MFLNHFRNKRVLITGHTGFKGSWLTLWLNKLDAKVSGYSKDIPTNPSLFESLNLEQKIEHNSGDILDYDSLKKVLFKSNLPGVAVTPIYVPLLISVLGFVSISCSTS